ncbi:bacterial proteasome activator family protein [Acidithrix sp. C25]|uniref:bacterial proteasome activator family protein n=1 Tax=Acidithrix sp. C25 TaxID=1671482 RepID=UPI00191BCA4E|nr:bacterial proteasome activator family protein [Acidithrix sp. C25]
MTEEQIEHPNQILFLPESSDPLTATQEGENDLEGETETVSSPSKVLRIGTMIKTLLEEVRQSSLDDSARARLKDIYTTSIVELKSGLSPDLASELDRLSLPFVEVDAPSDSELRLAQAQLVGWLEGLFHGIQAMLFAQQAQARSQLEEMRRRGLPAGTEDAHRPGTYL